jgi:hypothetical protein
MKHSLVVCLLLTLSFGSIASDSDRITQLEKEVQELKNRLTTLESPVNKAIVQKSTVMSDGWKNLANWRSLKKGSSYDEVRSILGEPEKVRASGSVTYWSYSNRGEATFMDDRLYGWNEPR